MNDYNCIGHSGCVARINNLEKEDAKTDERLKSIESKLDRVTIISVICLVSLYGVSTLGVIL